MIRRAIIGAGAVLLLVSAAPGVEMDRLKVQRKEVFAFTQKPSFARSGDRTTITFAVEDYCDATVAIEDADGGILRHLASGVLGPNAPEPFRRNSLKQSLVWDGKNDKGEYIDEREQALVRVSLGLKPQFERTLFWSPKKKEPGTPFLPVSAAPEGVYVLDGGTEGYQIRLFDHAGNYVRTVHPPPAGQAAGVQGLKWGTFPPDDLRVPLRPAVGGFLTTDLDATTGLPPTRFSATGIRAMVVQGKRLYVACQQVNRLATDGTTGGAPLSGPNVNFPAYLPGAHGTGGYVAPVVPESAALSPDGKWLYFAGYLWRTAYFEGCLNGVARLATDSDTDARVFLGVMDKKAGNDNAHFNAPSSVACDNQGRVYVSDYSNDRIQVYSPEGKHLKTIPVTRPAVVRIDRRTGDMWVFTWSLQRSYAQDLMYRGPAKVTHFGPFDNPAVIAAYPISVTSAWGGHTAEVDPWTDPPTIWLTDPEVSLMRLYVPQGRKLEEKRDFTREAAKGLARLRPPGHSRWRLHVNPKNGRCYVAEDHFPAAIVVKGSSTLIELDPETGRSRIINLAFDCEDLAFDLDGQAHLRAFGYIGRYDGQTWIERPFDYGENRRVSYQGLKGTEAASAAPFPDAGNASSQMGGFWVSPKGHIVITSHNPKHYDPKGDKKRRTQVASGFGGTKEVRGLQLMPGRADTCVIRVLDKFGRVLYEDAAPGVGFSEGVAMDKDDNLYVMAVTPGNIGGRPYPVSYACTLMKFRPRTKILTPGAPIAIGKAPDRPPDVLAWRDAGNSWVEGLEWAFPGVGMDTQNGKAGSGKCHCVGNSRFTLDLFGRSFAPELSRYDVVVIDSAGNAICRIGRYGNVDDGTPLVKTGGPPNPQSIGGDEVALMAGRFVATHTDRRLFIGDRGNGRILSVRLAYHVDERIPLHDDADGGP